MSKRLFILILCISLVLGSSVPVFAVSSDSAIKFKSLFSVSDTKATGSDYSQDIYNYIIGTNGFPAVSSGITALRNLITSHFYRNSGFTLYYWGAQSGISTSASGSGYFSNYLGSALTNLSSLLANADEQIWDTKQYLVQTKNLINDIHSIITSTDSAIEEVKVSNNPDNGFNQSYLWAKYSPTTVANSAISWFDGRSKLNQNFNAVSSSVLAQITYRLQLFSNSMVNLAVSLVGSIGSYNLTNTDLTTTALGSSSSLQNDVRNIGSNLSSHLARLAFVLASDEEIAARQAAAANTDQVVDDFINTSGSASASTSDFADVASAGSAMKDALSSNVSPSNAFTSLSSSSNAWDWFSQSTADSLDSSTRSNSRRGSSTPYLDSYYNDLLETLTFR